MRKEVTLKIEAEENKEFDETKLCNLLNDKGYLFEEVE